MGSEKYIQESWWQSLSGVGEKLERSEQQDLIEYLIESNICDQKNAHTDTQAYFFKNINVFYIKKYKITSKKA